MSNNNIRIKNNPSFTALNFNTDITDIEKLKLYGEKINKASSKLTPEVLNLDTNIVSNETTNNTTERRLILESSYLEQYQLEFNSLTELNNAITNIDSSLEEALVTRDKLNNRELDDTMAILERLKLGEDLDAILKSTIVAYEYQDEEGNVCYSYDATNLLQQGIEYKALTYEEMYGDSTTLKQLKSCLTKETIDPLFGDERTIYTWQDTKQQNTFYESISKKYSVALETREKNLEELTTQIENLQQQKITYEYIRDNINKEVEYYLENIDKYITQANFTANTSFNYQSLDSINHLKQQYQGTSNYDLTTISPKVYVYSKTEVVDVISCMLNEEGNVRNGYIQAGTVMLELSSNDSLLNNYVKWLPFISETEKEIFNYLYNTRGTDIAYQYLENISSELDNRWTINETSKDQKWASENPVLASLYSVVATPIEGVNAFFNSLKAKIQNQEIRQTNVYSSGDVYREQVGSDIDKEYGHIASFWYNTGMSMADSAMNTALILGTGGTGAGVISATTMGSRVYVSTLNDALDRGLSDTDAIALSLASAVTESAMESFSAGHLLKIDDILKTGAQPFITKITKNITDPQLAKIASNTLMVAYGAISQGLCEGEEEVSTEILNYFCDEIISGDLSNYSITVKNYLDLGYSENEAMKMASEKFKNQLSQAFLGGFASGLTFGMIGSGVSQYNDYNNKRKIAKELAISIQNDYKIKEPVLSQSEPTMAIKKEQLPNEFSVSNINELDATSKLITIDSLLNIITDNEIYHKFLNYEENAEYFENESKNTYLQAIIQLSNLSKKDNIDLELNEEQISRLDTLYDEALDKIPIEQILNTNFLQTEDELKFVLAKFSKTFTEEKIDQDPAYIYGSEFAKYVKLITKSKYKSEDFIINSEQFSKLDHMYVKVVTTAIYEIIHRDIDIGRRNFSILIEDIFVWDETTNSYVEKYTEKYNTDLANIKYNSDMSISLKLKLMLANVTIYDEEDIKDLCYEYQKKYNNLDLSKELTFLFDDLFQFFNSDLYKTFFLEKMRTVPRSESNFYRDYYRHCQNLKNIKLNQIFSQNIDIGAENFSKLSDIVDFNETSINYIENYLPKYQNLKYKNNLPTNIKKMMMDKINATRNDFFYNFSSGNDTFFGADQDATRKLSDTKYLILDMSWYNKQHFYQYLIDDKWVSEEMALNISNQLEYILEKGVTNFYLMPELYDIIRNYILFMDISSTQKLNILSTSFKKVTTNSEFLRLKSKLMKQGMTEAEAIKTLEALNTTGICTYAAVANNILMQFQKNPKVFKFNSMFGYSIITTINNEYRLNTAELLLDMYTYINSNACGGHLFTLKDNKLSIKNLNTQDQLYLAKCCEGLSEELINNFFKSKNLNIRMKNLKYRYYSEKNRCNIAKLNKIKEEVITELYQGNEVNLAVYKNETKQFRFFDQQGNVHCTTNNWEENGAHIVSITNVTDVGFEVISWGYKLIIPFEDLINNNFELEFVKLEEAE